MMKILVVAYKFGTVGEIGSNLGSYGYFLQQLKELAKNQVEITVLAPWVKWYRPGSTHVDEMRVIRYWPKLIAKRWSTVIAYKLLNTLYILRTGNLAKKFVAKLAVDAVYVRQARETGYAIAKVKPKLTVPLFFQPITTWRWHFENQGRTWFENYVRDTKNQKLYAQQTLEKFDFFITYNKSMQKEYVDMGASINKCRIIPGAVDHALFTPDNHKRKLRETLKLPMDKKLILYIGRINFEEKGIGYLLQAFRRLRSHHDDYHLILIGTATTHQTLELKQVIDDFKVGESVSFLGSKQYTTLPEYINACDVGVVPSIWFESSGRVSLDMLSCGLPVVVTNVGGLPEYSVDTKTGFVVEPRNADQLSNALQKILTNDALRMEMGDFARRHVLENYTFEAVTKKFLAVLDGAKR